MIDTIVLDRRKQKGRPFRIDYSPLLAESSVKRWVQFAELRPRTQGSYLWHLRDFLTRYAVPKLGVSGSADNLLQWAKGQADLDNVLLAMVDFGEHFNPQYSTQKVVNILRSFFHWNRLELPAKRQRTRIKSWHRGYSRQEMQGVLGFLDSPIQKLYAKVAKDSGLRMSALLSIRWKHLIKDLREATDGFVAIRFEPEFYLSSKSASVGFLGPDTVESLKGITRWNQSSSRQEPVYQDGRWTPDLEAKVFDFDDSTISESLNLAKRKAGIPDEVQPSHGFRKFFDNAILKMDETMPQEIKNQFLGHSLGVEWHYNERDVEQGGKLRTWYTKLYPLLDLREQAVVEQKFGELEKSLAEKTSHIESLKAELASKDVAFQDLRVKVEADLRRSVEEMQVNMRQAMKQVMQEEMAKRRTEEKKDGS